MLNSNDNWKPVVGFETNYIVSNSGVVVSTGAYIKSRKGKRVNQHPTTTSAYLYVKLWKGGKMYNRSVHRLVALAFIPNPDNLPVVNHLDGDKTNNHVSNLEWCSHSDNHRHAYDNRLRNTDSQVARFLGTKQGTASRYHNVSWDSTRGRWKAAVKHSGKVLGQRRFKTEVEAAEYVNQLLDEHNLHDRPRNIIT